MTREQTTAPVDEMIATLDAESTLDDPIERCFAVIEVSVRAFGREKGMPAK